MPGANLDSIIEAVEALGLSPSQLDNLNMGAIPDNLKDMIRSFSDLESPVAKMALNQVQEVSNARAHWERESKLPARRVPLTSRQELKRSYDFVKKEMNASLGSFNILQTFVGQDKSFSTIPVSDLESIMLKDMLANKVHKGRYLLCRTYTETVRRVAMELRVEDPSGDVVLLCVYNFPGLFQANIKTLDAYFPPNTIMAIREPWMKLVSTGVNAFIRVDSPSDVVILDPSDPILEAVTWRNTLTTAPLISSTSDSWRVVGNKYFQDKHFLPAAIAWSRGLSMDPSAHTLRLNRAQSYLKLEWFSAALADALHVADVEQCPPMAKRKALYRVAAAQYGLGRYAETLDTLGRLDKETDVSSLEAKSKKRLDEKKEGSYDWMKMFRDGQSPVPRLDVAEFVSPAINVSTAPSRGGGRCIKATRDIHTGDLLMVAKPFASAFPAELLENETIHSLNFVTNRVDKTASVALITNIVMRMHGCPEESDLIYHLYSGSRFSTPKAYPPPLQRQEAPLVPLQWKNDIDIARVDGAVTYNAFSPNAVRKVTGESLMSTGDEGGLRDTPSAIYTLPSIFNHSCHPNARWQCFGDVMVIRASECVSPGEEVTISYTSGMYPYSKREERLGVMIGGKCDCLLCEADRADGEAACRQRETLSDEMMKRKQECFESTGSTMSARVSESYLRQLLSTYRSERKAPRPELFRAYAHAMQSTEHDANVQGNKELVWKSIQLGFEALEAAGFTGVEKGKRSAGHRSRRKLPLSNSTLGVEADWCTLFMVHMAASFHMLSEATSGERWYRAAWWAHHATFGGGKALFDARLGECIKGIPVPVPSDYGWD